MRVRRVRFALTCHWGSYVCLLCLGDHLCFDRTATVRLWCGTILRMHGIYNGDVTRRVTRVQVDWTRVPAE